LFINILFEPFLVVTQLLHALFNGISLYLFLISKVTFIQYYPAVTLALKTTLLFASSILVFSGNIVIFPTNDVKTGVTQKFSPLNSTTSSSVSKVRIKEDHEGKIVESCKENDKLCWKPVE
jgi:hypothetical protein